MDPCPHGIERFAAFRRRKLPESRLGGRQPELGLTHIVVPRKVAGGAQARGHALAAPPRALRQAGAGRGAGQPVKEAGGVHGLRRESVLGAERHAGRHIGPATCRVQRHDGQVGRDVMQVRQQVQAVALPQCEVDQRHVIGARAEPAPRGRQAVGALEQDQAGILSLQAVADPANDVGVVGDQQDTQGLGHRRRKIL